jgi:hypothetical protein
MQNKTGSYSGLQETRRQDRCISFPFTLGFHHAYHKTYDEVEQGEQEGDDATGLETAGPIANDVAAQQSTMGGGAAAPTGGGF